MKHSSIIEKGQNMNDSVAVDTQGSIMEISINRPPANAINVEVSHAIHSALTKLQEDDQLQVAIITASGERIFSAGWDLKEIAAMDNNQDALNSSINCPGGFAGITEFWGLKKPVIAAVNGIAVGGGFEIALACDIIIASSHVEFFLPEMQRGFLPDAGAVQILPRRIPYNIAMEMLYTGRRMDMVEAKHYGLVNQVCDAKSLMENARAMAQSIASGAPLALQALKEVVPAIQELPLKQAFAETKPDNDNFPVYKKMLMSDDFMEGARAFSEKRNPVWKGK